LLFAEREKPSKGTGDKSKDVAEAKLSSNLNAKLDLNLLEMSCFLTNLEIISYCYNTTQALNKFF